MKDHKCNTESTNGKETHRKLKALLNEYTLPRQSYQVETLEYRLSEEHSNAGTMPQNVQRGSLRSR